jgi:DNA (cytosine-5)-methyltransferase 1
MKQYKTPFKIPSMSEIRDVEQNGFKVVSTFSGCGGSCLGFEMAGFEILWANEFVPSAQETYRANHPDTILDTRDIRKVSVADILRSTRLKVGELDVFEGSPPCSSFSMSGDREEKWGKCHKYSGTIKQVTDDLFFEYIRLLEGMQPKCFVAENVSGLSKGVARGYLKDILTKLKGCGYNVSAKLLDAKFLGVPQSRQRVIFVGTRTDLNVAPVHPTPLPYVYTVREAFAPNTELPGECWTLKEGTKYRKLWHWCRTHNETEFPKANKALFGKKSCFSHKIVRWDKPCPTLTVAQDTYHPDIPRSLTVPEAKRLCGFPDDFKLTGSYRNQWERQGRAVPPLMMRAVAEKIRDDILARID